MRMAFIMFDGMTTLDFAGFHNAVTWLKKREIVEDLAWEYCADKLQITDDRGLTMKADRVRPDLSGYDLVFIPGGMATRQLIHDHEFVAWMETAKSVPYKVSVCTGALLWGAAGFLCDKKVTTNPLALELLAPYCGEVIQARVVRDGEVFTGGGITASIDLGLFVVETMTSKETAQHIQTLMDYPYYQGGLTL